MATTNKRSRGTLSFERGMYHAGDPTLIPDGYASRIENFLSRPNGWVKRPPYVAESLTTSGTNYWQGFALWDDQTNAVSRLLAFRNNGGASSDIYLKSATDETWGAAINFTSTAGTLADYANYRGELYFTLTASEGQMRAPGGIYSFDGTTVTANPLGGETLYSRTVTAFLDRLFLGYVRASVTNQLGTTDAYVPTGWTGVNATRAVITNGSTVIGRVTPTNTSTASIRLTDKYTVAASTTDTHLVYRLDLRNTSPVYPMPFTADIFYSQIWVTATGYALGAIRVPTTLNGFRYRCTVAGTSGAGEPVWPTTVGTTIADGTATWICEGDEAVGEVQSFVPTLSDAADFTAWWVEATIPANPVSTKVGVRIKFGNDSITTYELAAIDVSQRDGVTDGSALKKCFGQQLTVGRFQYPFFNQETTATATQTLNESLYWTETSNPDWVRGANFYDLQEAPGEVTAAAVVGNRLVVFKQRGMWVFSGTNDPDIPIVLENFYPSVGCSGPRMLVLFENELFFVGKYEVYRWTPGKEPEPLAGDAMQSFIFTDPTLGFSFGFGTMAFCIVDEKRRDLRFSRGVSYEYVYNLDRQCWSVLRWVGSFPVTTTPNLQVYYPRTGNLYAAVNGSSDAPSIYLVDESSNTTDSDSAFSPEGVVTLRPLDSTPGGEVVLESVGVRYAAETTQTDTTFKVAVSLDDVASFAKFNTVTLTTLAGKWPAGGRELFPSTRVEVPLFQTGQRMSIQLVHTGITGLKAFALSPVVEVVVQRKRDNWQLSNPTAGTNNL
jgi:hypothetical protein